MKEIQFGIMCLMCVLLGILIGLFAARAAIRHEARRTEAPAPIDLGYDPNNPINGRREIGQTDPETGLTRIW